MSTGTNGAATEAAFHAAASRAVWIIDVTQNNARIVSDLAASYSNAARDLFST